MNGFFSRYYYVIGLATLLSSGCLAGFLFYKYYLTHEPISIQEEILIIEESKENNTTPETLPSPATSPSEEAENPTKTKEGSIPEVVIAEQQESVTPGPENIIPPEENNMPPLDPKAYCKGFSSLTAECSLKNLTIDGIIPTWLHGSLMAVGPAKFELNNSRVKHWLEGFSMVHQFSFENGKVSYNNRFLETTYYCQSIEKGKFSNATCAVDPNASYFAKLAAALSKSNDRPPYDNTNVNIINYGNCCIALTETPHMIFCDMRDLKTTGMCAYNDELEPHVSSAHPFIDPKTGELYNIATTFAKRSSYTVYKMNPKTLCRIPLTTIKASYPSYIHSFGVSNRYIIVTEVPYVVSPYDLVMSGKPYIENFNWKPKQKTKMTVISKATGAIVQTYELDPFFTFHHINAHDTGEQIFVDLIALPDASHMKSLYMNQIKQNKNITFPQGTIMRIALDLNSSKAKSIPLSPVKIEMPRINPEYMTKSYRYIYGENSSHPQAYYDQIVKIDLKAHTVKTWHHSHCYVTEPIFVPKPNGLKEDDGVVLSIILDMRSSTSSLIILDGPSLELVAKVRLPHHIPFTTHSNYFPK